MTDQLTQQQREALDALGDLEDRAWTRPGKEDKDAMKSSHRALRTYILNSTPVPEGVNLDFISEALADFAELIRSGNVDGAGQFSPSELQEQSDLLDVAPAPEDSRHWPEDHGQYIGVPVADDPDRQE